MALGRAFIEVHADTRPFARDLGRELDRILRNVERTTVRQAGTRMGQTLAQGVGQGGNQAGRNIGNNIRRGLQDSNVEGTFARFATGIIDTIDDGISGLPAEIKAVLGGALLILAPIAFALGSGIAAALVAGILGGLAGGVIAIVGSQFEEVRDAAKGLVFDLRDIFLVGAAQFIGPILDAIALIRTNFLDIMPDLQLLFRDIAKLATPLAQIFINLVRSALPGLQSAFANLEPSLLALADGALLIGEAIGTFFSTIIANDDTPRVIYDLAASLAFLVDVLTVVINHGINLYGVLIDVADVLGIIEGEKKGITAFTNTGNAAQTMGQKIQGTIIPLEAQEKQIEENNKALKEYLDFQFDIVGGEIEFQQGIDDLTAALKRNGDTLKLTSQAGRDNATVLLDLARNIINTRNQTILMGGDVDTATTKFNKQREEIYKVGRQFGLTDKEINDLIKSLLDVPPPITTGVTPLTLARLALAISRVKTLKDLLNDLQTQADIAAVVAQAAASASRANTNPTGSRGALGQLSTGAGLLPPISQTAPIQTGRSTVANQTVPVNVYIGNDQIDSHTDRVVRANTTLTARELQYGNRDI